MLEVLVLGRLKGSEMGWVLSWFITNNLKRFRVTMETHHWACH